MKKIMVTLATITVLATIGCEKYVPPTIKDFENKSQTIMQTKASKRIAINLTNKLSGPEKRYYDLDGDLKTVEQYVIVSDSFNARDVYLDLVRPGWSDKAEFCPSCNDDRYYPQRRYMTEEEIDQIDKEYRDLLKIYCK